MEHITSRHNPLMGHIRRLAGSAAYRWETGEFLCDSPKLLQEALLWQAEITAVVTISPLPRLPEHIRQVQVPEDVMASISPVKTPQGVLFTCRLPQAPLPRSLTGRRYVLLDGVQDPGNVGTILRTLDAFDADGLLLTGGCADPYGRVPPPHLFRHTGGTGGPAAPQRPAPVRGRPAGGHRGRPAGGLHPLHAGHRQRGPWPEPGGTGPVRPNHPHPHVGPLRISECSHCRSGAAVGKLAIRRDLTWLL